MVDNYHGSQAAPFLPALSDLTPEEIRGTAATRTRVPHQFPRRRTGGPQREADTPSAYQLAARKQSRSPAVTMVAPGSGRWAVPSLSTHLSIARSRSAALPPSFHQLATLMRASGSTAAGGGHGAVAAGVAVTLGA